MRLIDADELLEEIVERMTLFRALGKERVVQNYDFAATVVGDAPTVDAVPVVRCRECKYYRPKANYMHCACPGGMLCPPDANGFCSYGQRRDQSAEVRNMGQSAGAGKTSGRAE